MSTSSPLRFLTCLALLVCGSLFALGARAEDIALPGTHRVEVLTETWTDAARANREVPAKIYYPADLTEPAPMIIFSHGLGASRESYAYFGRYLASHGYICVHVTHVGSDTDALRAAVRAAMPEGAAVPDRQAVQVALRKIAADLANAVNRPRDVSFAIDRMLESNTKDGPLKGHIDAKKIGVAGHSFGAYTAMAVAGETFARGINYRDPRVRAAVVMSAPARKPSAAQLSSISIPLLVMTGTLDESPVVTANAPAGGSALDQRRAAFDLLIHSDRYLLIFEGGDHMAFSGRPPSMVKLPGAGGDPAKDPQFQDFIKASSLRFFDACLKGDQAAQQWLTAVDGAKATLGKDGTWKHEKAQ